MCSYPSIQHNFKAFLTPPYVFFPLSQISDSEFMLIKEKEQLPQFSLLIQYAPPVHLYSLPALWASSYLWVVWPSVPLPSEAHISTLCPKEKACQLQGIFCVLNNCWVIRRSGSNPKLPNGTKPLLIEKMVIDQRYQQTTKHKEIACKNE